MVVSFWQIIATAISENTGEWLARKEGGMVPESVSAWLLGLVMFATSLLRALRVKTA
jgi:hypothetical protein